MILVAGVYAGAPDDATAALAPLARLGTPLMDLGATVRYVDVQSALDPAFPADGRYFLKSHFMDGLTDQAIEALLGGVRPQRRAPGPGPPDLRSQRPVRRRCESALSSRRQVASAVAVETFDDDVEPPQDLPEQPNNHLAVAGRHEGLRVRGLNSWFG